MADHLLGLFGLSGKRLILTDIKTFSIIISITILAYLAVIFHSFNFTVPISLLAQFIAILAAFAIFLNYIDPPLSLDGAAA